VQPPHQCLDAQLKVGLGEHRLDGAVGQLGGDGQHLSVDLAQLGDQRLVGGDSGPLGLGEVRACFLPVGLILEQAQVTWLSSF
jgi:hypothetical protein